MALSQKAQAENRYEKLRKIALEIAQNSIEEHRDEKSCPSIYCNVETVALT